MLTCIHCTYCHRCKRSITHPDFSNRVLCSVQFSSTSRWDLWAQKSPDALRPISQKFPQRCLWNDSDAVWGILIDVSSLVQDPHCADEIWCFCLCSFVMWRRQLWLRVVLVWHATGVVWFGPSGLASDSVMPVMTLTLASDQGQYVDCTLSLYQIISLMFCSQCCCFLSPDFSRALFGVA